MHSGDNPRFTEKNGTPTVTNTTVQVFKNRRIEPGQQTDAVERTVLAAFTATPRRPTPNQTITFDGSLSYGLNSTVTDYEWAFGDGTTTTGEKVTHTYTEAGTYTVTLIVTDTSGQTNITTTQVEVVTGPDVPGVRDGVASAVAGDDGTIERSDVLGAVQAFINQNDFRGVSITRSDILNVVQFFIQQG